MMQKSFIKIVYYYFLKKINPNTLYNYLFTEITTDKKFIQLKYAKK